MPRQIDQPLPAMAGNYWNCEIAVSRVRIPTHVDGGFRQNVNKDSEDVNRGFREKVN
jgi:hypothetical protein